LEHQYQMLQEDGNIKTTQIAELMKMAVKVEQQIAVIEGFRQEMAKFDYERRQWQAEATESLTTMKQDQDAFRSQLERQESSVHGVQRTVDRVAGELGRIQEASNWLREQCDRRLSQQSKTLNTFKTDLEVKLVSLETRHNKLSDDLWGEETGLAKVMHDLSRTNQVVADMTQEFAAMKHDKASISQLQVVQEEVNNFTNEASNNVSSLKITVDRMMSDVKAHFKTATETVATNNAKMIQEVRSAYQEELREAATVRDEVTSFMQSEKEQRLTLENSLCESQSQTEEVVRNITQEVEEVAKTRRRDRNSQEVEIKNLGKTLHTVQESSESVSSGLQHLSTVLWTMVQCERAASALDLQDDQDRSKIALMGYKEESGQKDSRASKRSGSRGAPALQASQNGSQDRTNDAVINVDERCLSCCGKAQTVLSGFKMACLQYTPAPITFSRKLYNRGELLTLRERLLMQAHESLQFGPTQFSKPELFGTAPTSILSAGAIAESLAKKIDRDRPESRTSNGSGRGKAPSMPPIRSRGAATAR